MIPLLRPFSRFFHHKRVAQTSEEFEKKLIVISRIYAFVGPIGILAICAAAEFATDYYTTEQRRIMLPFLAVVFAMLGSRIFFRKISKLRLGLEYATIIVLASVAYVYLLQFPSPYIVAGFVFSVLVYFDFGWKWAAACLAVQYVPVLMKAIITDLPASVFIDVIAYTLTPTAISIFVIRLQSLARQEILSIEKNYEKAIENAQQTLSLVNNISDGVIAIDDKFKILTYNAAALDVLDVNLDLSGKDLTKLLLPVDENKNPVHLEAMLRDVKGPTSTRDLLLSYKDGSTSNLYIGIAPIYLGYGKRRSNGYTLLLRDITREKSLEEERDEFISVVSHELRTPIAISEGSIGNAEFVLEKGGDPAVIKQALAESHKQVLFLADMINDLSTLSRAERGVLEVEVEPINVHDLCEELGANYTKSAADKGLVLSVEVDPKLEMLSSSRLYVKEILQNFITNAIKYTVEGSVVIAAKAAENGVTFDIRDTGIGISKADQERVFDKFFRSEDFRTRQSNGTGLGLYVTMKLMRLIHATVDIKSEINKGSTFSIHIPNYKKED